MAAQTPLIDAVGVQHSPCTESARIACLVPSITELLFALSLQPIARTHYCIHPKTAVETVASVGGTKKINHDKLAALKPSHVILNVDENTTAMAAEISRYVPNIIVTHPLAPDDNLHLYQLLGGIFNRQRQAQHLCQRYSDAKARLREAAHAWPSRQVLYLIWCEPWMTIAADTYIARMLNQINWFNMTTDSEQRYPSVEITAKLAAELDLILFSTEPYSFKAADLYQFAQHYRVSPQKLALIDGEMTSWYGSRAISGMDYLVEFGNVLTCR